MEKSTQQQLKEALPSYVKLVMLEENVDVATIEIEEKALLWLLKHVHVGMEHGYPTCCILYFVKNFAKARHSEARMEAAKEVERILCDQCLQYFLQQKESSDTAVKAK